MGDLLKGNLDLVSHPAFGFYYEYCVTSLKKHGEHVAEKLVSREHYFRWSKYCSGKEGGPFMFVFSCFPNSMDTIPTTFEISVPKQICRRPWKMVSPKTLGCSIKISFPQKAMFSNSTRSRCIYSRGKEHVLGLSWLSLSQTKDPLNQARSLMKLPVDPCLDSKDDDGAEPPKVKRAKTGKLVQDAILREPLRMVPSQAVHCSRILHLNFPLVLEELHIFVFPNHEFPIKNCSSFALSLRL